MSDDRMPPRWIRRSKAFKRERKHLRDLIRAKEQSIAAFQQLDEDRSDTE